MEDCQILSYFRIWSVGGLSLSLFLTLLFNPNFGDFLNCIDIYFWECWFSGENKNKIITRFDRAWLSFRVYLSAIFLLVELF